MTTFFGGLPLELRILIYRELLTSDKPVDAIQGRNLRHAKVKPRLRNKVHPAILRTCKQAYNEAFKYLYEDNRIRIDLFDYLCDEDRLQWNDWYGFGKSKFMQIKHLEIAYQDAARDITMRYGEVFPNHDKELVRLVHHLDGFECQLESFRLTFYFYPQQNFLSSLDWSNYGFDVPEVLAYNPALREAVAAFPVKSVVEIVVDSGEEHDCEGLRPFVHAVGSLKQWVLTLDQETVTLDHDKDVSNEKDGDDDDAKQKIEQWAIAVQDQANETDNEEDNPLREAINEYDPDGEKQEHHDESLTTHCPTPGNSDEIEDRSSLEIAPEVGTADIGEANSDSDGDDNDEQQDRSDHTRHIWTFTLRPATLNTERQIPTWPETPSRFIPHAQWRDFVADTSEDF